VLEDDPNGTVSELRQPVPPGLFSEAATRAVEKLAETLEFVAAAPSDDPTKELLPRQLGEGNKRGGRSLIPESPTLELSCVLCSALVSAPNSASRLTMNRHGQPHSDDPCSTSSSLIEQVRARHADAWARLARLYTPLVYRWARQRGLQDADAADVVQEVFRSVATRINSFRQDQPGASFRGWLWTITYHKLGDYFRRVSSQPEAAGGTDAQHRLQQTAEISASSLDGPRFDADASLLHRALHVLRGEFEERTWQAFWRATVDGQATSDIAQDLGMTIRAVRQAKYRVLRRLREELTP
jgi:RNA polymerase sigma-70 factor (ECF subfamily)